jgi:putative methanogenesis marker 16 metalloprotein
MAKIKSRTIEDINKRIRAGKATVMSGDELQKILKKGEKISWEDVDVVTSATCGLMSGTIAILSFPVSGRGVFTRASEVLMNGILAYPGPCPNERLGVIDLIVYGTSHSTLDEKYGGGHLFKDIVKGKSITINVRSKEGKKINKEITRDDLGYARLQGVRSCFKNYIGMINKSKDPISSIFHVSPIQGPYKELSVCGCGALNPIAMDPHLEVIGVGTKILINDAEGYVTGLGTRSSPEKPNLSGYADMFTMDPYFMGGFQTAEGPEVITCWAVPIPILNQKTFKNVCKTEALEPLPIADISNRVPFMESNYGHIWDDTDITVRYSQQQCLKKHEQCKAQGLITDDTCPVERICPVGAYTTKTAKLDRKLCFNCGACVRACKAGCFKMKMGEVEIDDRKVPITLRQSDRARAIKLAKRLNARILSGDFKIAEKVGSIFH